MVLPGVLSSTYSSRVPKELSRSKNVMSADYMTQVDQIKMSVDELWEWLLHKIQNCHPNLPNQDRAAGVPSPRRPPLLCCVVFVSHAYDVTDFETLCYNKPPHTEVILNCNGKRPNVELSWRIRTHSAHFDKWAAWFVSTVFTFLCSMQSHTMSLWVLIW